jgi:hypothetical protein
MILLDMISIFEVTVRIVDDGLLIDRFYRQIFRQSKKHRQREILRLEYCVSRLTP